MNSNAFYNIYIFFLLQIFVGKWHGVLIKSVLVQKWVLGLMHVIRASNEDFIDHQSIFEDAFEATASIIHTSEDERSDTPYDRCEVKVVELFAVSTKLATGGWL